MSLAERVKALQDKHASLDRMLDDEEHRPLPDDTAIHDLKRQKLAIKDEITRLTDS